METPCVNVCMLDDEFGWCIGCGRSGEEIAAWADMSPAERREIMASLPARLDRMAHVAETEKAAS